MATFVAYVLAWTVSLVLPVPAVVQPNDNLQAAGRHENGVLTVRLRAATGVWHPKGSSNPGIEVAAFGEETGELSAPGPLIRARAGTAVVMTVRNDLDAPLTIFGLCSKPGPCNGVTIAPESSRGIEFSLNAPGTYAYWASRSARTITSRPAADSQLGGAIIVDPLNGSPADRVMVISIHGDTQPLGLCLQTAANGTFTINGRSWPYAPRLRHSVGETVRFRVINLSCDQHAMHLHGFHFSVETAGDGLVDSVPVGGPRTEVTEVVAPGRTFALSWTPTRSGNWLFHCHMVGHMVPSAADLSAHHGGTDDAGMAGLVVGIEVDGPVAPAAPTPQRHLTMLVNEDRDRYGKNQPGFRVDIDSDAPRLNDAGVRGPVLILHRGEPTEITVVNRTSQPTAIHWHGLEIDSYFDGVPGFGGQPGRIAPAIEAGQSFVARMTPPRAGTYIYHTHWHDEAQLAGGLYGPLIVLGPGERYDPAVDHIVMIGLNGVVISGQREPFAINGRRQPDVIHLRVGVPNRIRLINITPNNVALSVALMDQSDPVQWTPLAKDGADIDSAHAIARPARQPIGVGETYDFQITPVRSQNLWLEVRRGNGEWVLQAPIEAR